MSGNQKESLNTRVLRNVMNEKRVFLLFSEHITGFEAQLRIFKDDKRK